MSHILWCGRLCFNLSSPLLSLSLTVQLWLPAPRPLGAEAYLPTFMSGFLATLMEEVLVVLAYFSRSKSTLPQRCAQPNQKERIQPQSREEREAESKYVEVALCSLIQSKQTPDWIFYKNSPRTLAVKKKSADIFGKCMLANALGDGKQTKTRH